METPAASGKKLAMKSNKTLLTKSIKNKPNIDLDTNDTTANEVVIKKISNKEFFNGLPIDNSMLLINDDIENPVYAFNHYVTDEGDLMLMYYIDNIRSFKQVLCNETLASYEIFDTLEKEKSAPKVKSLPMKSDKSKIAIDNLIDICETTLGTARNHIEKHDLFNNQDFIFAKRIYRDCTTKLLKPKDDGNTSNMRLYQCEPENKDRAIILMKAILSKTNKVAEQWF